MTQPYNSTLRLRLAIFAAIALLCLLAFAVPARSEPPPFAGPEMRGDCPKGFIKKRGKCWRRTVDDISVFQTEADEDAWEREVERRLEQLQRKPQR